MIQDPRKRMEAQTEKLQEMFTRELEDLKNKQRWITMTEMKNTLEGINSRVMVSERPLGTFKSFYTEKNTQYLHPLMFTLRLSGSSALPAYPGFMVMKTAQVGFRESSVPSKMNIFSFRIMACWMLRICWATTDSTSTWVRMTGWWELLPLRATRPTLPEPPFLQWRKNPISWEYDLHIQN